VNVQQGDEMREVLQHRKQQAQSVTITGIITDTKSRITNTVPRAVIAGAGHKYARTTDSSCASVQTIIQTHRMRDVGKTTKHRHKLKKTKLMTALGGSGNGLDHCSTVPRADTACWRPEWG